AHGVFGMSVITAVTAQNSQGVFALQDISPDIIEKQIEVIFEDISVDGVKIGMVSKTETIKIIADTLKRYQPKNLVVDPLMIYKSGFDLLKPQAKEPLIDYLLTMAKIITPNLPEAEVITGLEVKTIEDMEKAAKAIYKMGPKYVLIKGGHLE